MRFRVKLGYKIDNQADTDDVPPPLKLDILIVCRETLECWPRYIVDKTNVNDLAYEPYLFWLPVVVLGGLYYLPLIESQEDYNMLLDLDGGASLLFPCTLKQDDSDNYYQKGMLLVWIRHLVVFISRPITKSLLAVN